MELLFQTQLHNGGWPLISSENNGSIISTCCAIHALSMDKPKGYEKIIKRGAKWILSQQEINGFWYESGEDSVMLTVLALESIHLASGGLNNSFSLDTKFSKDSYSVEKDENDVHFDYSKEEWFLLKIPEFITVSLEEAKIFKPKIALVTAIEIELNAVLKKMKPPKGMKKVRKVVSGSETYYLGVFGAFETVVTKSSMGSQGPSGSTLTVASLINDWDPTAIILVGIAFGAYREKQKEGDVLIAESLIPYENQRISEGRDEYRNDIIPSSNALINRFMQPLDWKFYHPTTKEVVKMHFGKILTGEKLIDNKDFKKNLLEKYPKTIGGEMEGSGLYSAAEKYKKHWVLIKSVCDWADGNKTDKYQSFAAASAVSFCEFVFNNKHALDNVK